MKNKALHRIHIMEGGMSRKGTEMNRVRQRKSVEDRLLAAPSAKGGKSSVIGLNRVVHVLVATSKPNATGTS
jgi:hypothetical protein